MHARSFSKDSRLCGVFSCVLNGVDLCMVTLCCSQLHQCSARCVQATRIKFGLLQKLAICQFVCLMGTKQSQAFVRLKTSGRDVVDFQRTLGSVCIHG